ncbi:uncharacterized protein LOC121390502 [Gigantopelta aegis]|uniref:uncharacterized protein LOC121390502 n=1 Tax=Gigantopelta aegis TaxID=1735272 RepID=UPI001B88970D|nr:uncharacterized protein LOC121390502 [Gigantopelta aegis]
MVPRVCKWSLRSLRDLFLFLIFIMVLSIVMTINMSRHLPWLQPQPDLNIHVDGHLNIYRSLQLSDGKEEGWRKRAAARRSTRLGKQIPDEHRALVQRLVQLEDESLPQKTKLPVVILVEGSLSAIKHEVPLIESAFRQLGAEVKFKVRPDSVVLSRTVQSISEDKDKKAWTVLMCLSSLSSEACHQTSTLDLRQRFQKRNIIPQLQSLLFEPELLCEKDKEGPGIMKNTKPPQTSF